MKLSKRVFEIYKWLPFFIMVNHFLELYYCGLEMKNTLVHLSIFFVAIVPFVFIHSIMCRHVYTKCEKKDKKSGDNYYEL